jgi:alkaline phosphatase D
MRSRFLAVLILALVSARSMSAQDSSGEAATIERILFGSCNRDYRPQPLWKPILANKPDLWIWLGDIVYGGGPGDKVGLATRLATQKAQPDYKALHDACPIIGVWDDNDFGKSDAGGESPTKAANQKLLLDFLDEPPESPRRQQAGLFATYTYGPLGKQVKVILLDGRYHREKPGAHADNLGAEQWAWLERQLTASPADVHLIGSGIQVLSSQHPFEKWADFPKARQRLLDLLARTGARNVILLSGDRHFGEISRLNDPRLKHPLFDLTSSGLTHFAQSGLGNLYADFRKEPNPYRCGEIYLGLNFGMITFDWEATPRRATLEIRDEANTVRIEERLTLQ